MKTTIYKAGDPDSHKQLGKTLQALQPGEYVIHIRKNRPVRSLSANKYYHAILKIIAIETGHTHEQLHDICKKKFNGDVIHFPKGGMEIVGKTTSYLKTKEFAAYVNRVKHWAQEEWSISIPEAKDMDYKRWLDIEIAYDENNSGF